MLTTKALKAAWHLHLGRCGHASLDAIILHFGSLLWFAKTLFSTLVAFY